MGRAYFVSWGWTETAYMGGRFDTYKRFEPIHKHIENKESLASHREGSYKYIKRGKARIGSVVLD